MSLLLAAAAALALIAAFEVGAVRLAVWLAPDDDTVTPPYRPRHRRPAARRTS